MTIPNALWVNVSPALKIFNRRLLSQLSHYEIIACWEYSQTLDEPISLEIAIELLHDYLQSCSQSLHLIGHSTGGLLALLYARRYPERVRSLTLLSVGAHPAIDWQAHFYVLLQLLPCSREMILTQMVGNLFGRQSQTEVRRLIQVLKNDLRDSLSPHTLWERVSLPPGDASVPMLVCGSQNDVIVDPQLFQSWKTWLKEGDRLWQCPEGRHFFHYFQPKLVSEQVIKFWMSVDLPQSAPETPALQLEKIF
jgi:pimeloyl-ACP methyl ester carboxylesterase